MVEYYWFHLGNFFLKELKISMSPEKGYPSPTSLEDSYDGARPWNN